MISRILDPLSRWTWGILAFVAVGSPVRAAYGAVIDDMPACHCLQNIAMGENRLLDENIRRTASRIVDAYCDENRSLDDLAGSDAWIARQSCDLVDAAFQDATWAPDDARGGSPLEIRFGIRVQYRAAHLRTSYFVDWRQSVGIYGWVSFTLRPARLRAHGEGL